MAKGNGIFDADPFGLGSTGGDIFSTPKGVTSNQLPNLPRPRAPSPTQQAKEQKQALIDQYVQEATTGIEQLRSSNEWLNASLSKRKDMYKNWTTQKYMPMVNALQDSEVKTALRVLPSQVLYPDIANLAKSIDEGPGQLKATGIGAYRNVARTTTQLIDNFVNAPADDAKFAAGLEKYKQDTGAYPKFGTPEYDNLIVAAYENRLNSPVRRAHSLERSDLIHEADQKLTPSVVARTPLYKQYRNDGLSEPVALAKARRELSNQLVGEEIQRRLQLQLGDLSRKSQVTQDLDSEATARQGAGQLDRNIQREEDKEAYGDFVGTLRNSVRGNIPFGNTLQAVGEQAGTIAPVVAATYANPLLGVGAGAVLGGSDAVVTAQQQIQKLTPEQLSTIPMYTDLVNSGRSPDEAKATIAALAGSNAGLYGQILGGVTAIPGAEGVLGTGLRAFTRAGSVAAPTARQAVAKGLSGTVISGVAAGGNQFIANNAAQNVGAPISATDGVSEATAQGIVLGAPLAAGGARLEYSAGRRNTTPTEPSSILPDGITTSEGTAPTATAPISAGAPVVGDAITLNDGSNRSGLVASANEDGTLNVTVGDQLVANVAPDTVTVANPIAGDTAPVTSSIPQDVVTQLRQTIQDINQSTEPLNIIQRDAILQQFISAEQAGVPRAAIEAGLQSVVGNTMDGVSLYDAYLQRANTNGQPTSTVAGDGLTRPVATRDTADVGTVDTNGANRATEATSPAVLDSDGAVERAPTEAGSSTTTRTEPSTIADNGTQLTDPVLSRSTSDPTTTDVSNAPTATELGRAATEQSTNRGSDNSPVSDTVARDNNGERVPRSEARQSADDGQLPQGDVERQTGINRVDVEAIKAYDDVVFNPATNTVEVSRTRNGVTETVPMDSVTSSLIVPPNVFNRAIDITTTAGSRIQGTLARVSLGDTPTLYISNGGEARAVRSSDIASISIDGNTASMSPVEAVRPSILADGTQATLRLNTGETVQGTVSDGSMTANGNTQYSFRGIQPDGRVITLGNIDGAQLTPTDGDPSVATTAASNATTVADAVETIPSVDRTPAGRDVSSLQAAIEKFTDTRNDDVFLSLGELQGALELKDFATADSIADTLHASGRSDFAAPIEPTGSSARYLSEALTSLSEQDRTTLGDAYRGIKNELPAEFNSETAFHNAMVIDALQEISDGVPITPWYNKLSTEAKSIFKKLAGLMSAVVMAIAINMGSPINDAVAQTGATYRTTPSTVQTIPDGMSRSAGTINNWIRQANDNKGQSYIIADKQAGRLYIMNSKGEVVHSAPALFGKNAGDGKGYGQTPAGVFNLTHRTGYRSFGGDIQQFSTDARGNLFAIHRVTTDKPSQHRLHRLASNDPEQSRISLGCINVPAQVYNQYLSKGFGGRLYVLPDQGRLTDTFSQFRQYEMAQQLKPNTPMPTDIGDSRNTQVTTNTYSIADRVTQNVTPSDNIIGTVAAADMTNDISSASYVNTGNDVSDMIGWGILATAGLVAGRRMLRTRRANRAGQNEGSTLPAADELGNTTLPPVEPTDPLTPSMYNPSNVGSGGRDGSVWTGQVQQRNQVQNLAEQGARAGNWARMAFRDYMAPVVDFEADSGLIPAGREFDSGPLAQNLKLSSSTRQNIASEYQRTFIQPMIDLSGQAALRLSMDAPVAFDLMGTWRTMLHIPEANRELRKQLVAERDQTLLTGDAMQSRRAAQAVDDFDAWMNGTSERRVATAGGLTDRRAEAIRQSIEAIGFTRQELEAFSGHIDGAIKRVVDDRLQAGTLLPEEVQAWERHNFEHYVPLTVPKETPTGDGFAGTSILNPAGDRQREGSNRLASSSGFAVVEFLNRTANDLAMVPVRKALVDVHSQLEATGDTHGLHKVNLRDTANPMYSTAMSTPGIIRNVKTVREDGTVGYSKEKYFFDDRNLTRALFEPPRDIVAIQKAQGVTRTVFGLITRYQPLFPVKTYVPDVMERIYNIGTKNLFTETGERVSPLRLRTRMVANFMNPAMYVQVARSMRGDHVGSFGRAAAEVRELGGTTTYRDLLKTQVSDIRKDLMRSTGIKRTLDNLDSGILNWVEYWGELAVTNTYKALRDSGVAPRDAAFRTKDLLNFHNKGRYTGTLRAIKPFINATIEGNYNMVRSLGTSRGRYEAFGMVVAGMGLYALLQSMAPNDNDLGSKLDSLSIDELSRSIPLWTSDGSYAKLPVGFGMPQVAWTTAVALSRLRENTMTPAEATSAFALVTLKNVQPIDIPIAIAHDNPMAAFLQIITPAILLPEAQLGMNRNAFGGRIHADKQFGQPAAEASMARTSPVWSTVARNVSTATGGKIDMYPESIRHLAQGHLIGPLSGLFTYWDKDTQITRPMAVSARQEAGPLLTAVGGTYFFGNDASLVQQRYYSYEDRAEGILNKYKVTATDASNRGRPGQAGVTAESKLLAAGATPDEATLVRLVVDSRNALTRQKRILSTTIKPYKQMDMSIESLRDIYLSTAQEEESIMRTLINSARTLQK